MIDWQRAQAYMRENRIHGWLVCDFRGSNPVLWQVLGRKKWTTRRCFVLGVNLDDLETHDTRWVLPGVGFSVEPGIYLPEFGVRSEINVFMHREKGPLVTTAVQEKIVLLV